MPETREPPGWAEPLCDTDPDGRIVRCEGCGRAMSWRQFLDHGPACPDASDPREQVEGVAS